MKYLALIALLISTPTMAQDFAVSGGGSALTVLELNDSLLTDPVILAQTVEQLDRAKRAMMERDAADRVAKAAAQDVSTINIRVDLATSGGPGPGNRQQSTDVVLSPSDPEFADVLAAAKAAYARKAAAAVTDLEEVGISAERK